MKKSTANLIEFIYGRRLIYNKSIPNQPKTIVHYKGEKEMLMNTNSGALKRARNKEIARFANFVDSHKK
jgi:hypothetical protein